MCSCVQASELAKELVKANAALKHQEAAVLCEKQGLKAAQKAVKDSDVGIVAKANEASKALESHAKIVSECAAKERLFNDLVLLCRYNICPLGSVSIHHFHQQMLPYFCTTHFFLCAYI